ncbi:glycosyltransferase family 39 protein [Xanthomonas citri pv. mangiferaeindicae]|uniref:ArnT family glycosyltransferase n=1 Tax=Xanthomonas citri TaxID=346 RepID=UPI000255244B|nr:glycosyltransferase family 39 protein [Xanthomonas citri]OOW51868.1 dolichyl-phosphate-mannose--protein mannosyltransferase [Xanthomonas campestris pv. centellae]UDB87637.1 glycosyltransferase family 39 protein [Xanthomonas citri pv. mangiferaeindicae]UDI83184.1 dolichyl-phosphate-mannose-protein mannosyltransferase [Xanthomonas citri pv. mangiferaeindicae]CCG36352.1 dolichyl-phosphate-mannose-mannosyltransferase family protein [Xanthomonas citri pv. mangiferaeindicae LMG 941]
MFKNRASTDVWLLAMTAVLVIGAGLGLRDPWPADEPRFALVAKQMVLSGDWLFPHRGNELYSDKPPMLMWLQALSYTLLGNWRVAFLLPSLLAALGTLACVYDLGRRMWTRRVGLYAAWMLLFTLHFTFQAKKAQIDPLVVFWITLANYGLLRHLLMGPAWRWWTLGWFSAGLGVITKGVGIIALLMLIPAGIAAARGWAGVRVHVLDRRFWLGPLFFFVAILLWFVPMMVTALTAGQPEYRVYLNDILLRQTAKRYASSWDHAQPVWYHLQSMATMWLPTILLLPWAIPAWRRRLKRRDPRYLLPLAWWLLVLVFFTIPSGKRDVYILPALPMFCLALAPLVPGLLRRAGVQRLLFGFGVLLALVFSAGGTAMLIGHPGFEQKIMDSRGVGSEATDPLGWLLLAVGTWGVASLLLMRVRRSAFAVVSLLGAWWVAFGLVCYPIFNDSSSAGAVMREAGRRIGPDAQLGLVAWKEQNLLMADRPAQTFGFKVPWETQLQRGVAWQAQQPGQRWLMAQETALLACVDRSRSQLVGVANRRRWWLVPGDAVHGDCVASSSERAVEAKEQGNLDTE